MMLHPGSGGNIRQQGDGYAVEAETLTASGGLPPKQSRERGTETRG